MKRQALGAVKRQVALMADGGRFLLVIVVRARIGLIAITRSAGSPLAWVLSRIVVLEAAVALVTPITPIDEACNGGASFIMGVAFE